MWLVFKSQPILILVVIQREELRCPLLKHSNNVKKMMLAYMLAALLKLLCS